MVNTETVNNMRESQCKVILLVGKESVGKTLITGAIAGKRGSSSNFQGTTIACEKFSTGDMDIIDTPGLLLGTDAITTRIVVDTISKNDDILLVLNGTQLDDDIKDLIPIVRGKRGIAVVTYWDKIKHIEKAASRIREIEDETGIPFITVDARKISKSDIESIRSALSKSGEFPVLPPASKAGWRLESRKNIFDIPFMGQIIALLLLLTPAWIAVQNANIFADAVYERFSGFLSPALESLNSLPAPLSQVLGGDYGIVAMGPFLLIYALPTVLIFSILLSVYKTTGLADMLSSALHPVVKNFGLAGRDLVRVMMGFGCNVPAVINSRACATCTRQACISAISFGSACSYQLPATIAVFAAAGMSYLVIPYMSVLAVTTLIYLYLTTSKNFLASAKKLTITGRTYLQFPDLHSIWYESWGIIRQFLFLAMPVFIIICIGAALIQWAGLLNLLIIGFAPFMSVLNLPGDASVSVILGSVRKDGIAIGLLNSDWTSLKTGVLTPVQVLTVVYIAGVLLPCLVTLLTVMKEVSVRFALKMAVRQAAAAIIFAFIIAWTGELLYHYI